MTPTASTRTQTPAPSDLAWTRTASFPVAGGLSTVDQVVRFGDEFLAFGVEFVHPLPGLGPTPPHEARAWVSVDGRTWEPVELGPGFENAGFGQVVQRDDGTLLSLGRRGIVEGTGIFEFEPAAWTTSDGRTWTEVDPPLDGFATIAQGAKGVLAALSPSSSTGAHELWLSTNGEDWERVHALEADFIDIGAGDQGFGAVGWVSGTDGPSFSIASADGRDWIDGPVPPFGRLVELAPRGGDWVVAEFGDGAGPTWWSANGLDWTSRGEVPLRTVEADDVSCREYPVRLESAGPWLILGSELSFPCSEGGFMAHGTQYLSVDGAAWSPIPLAEGTPGQNRSGSSVNDALATDGGLILVGEENGKATFWFGEAP